MASNHYDVIVVGGGPVGLYAGLRSTLLFLRTHIVDQGRKWSRGYHVPSYPNIPTHPQGIEGKEVIRQLRKGLTSNTHYGSIDDFVTINEIIRNDNRFTLQGLYHPSQRERTYTCETVVLATGVVDRQPIIAGTLKTILPYANRRLICYCIICDGAYAHDKHTAVIGTGKTAVLTALRLLHFHPTQVTILTHGDPLFHPRQESPITHSFKTQLTAAGVHVVTNEIRALFGVNDQVFGVEYVNGERQVFDIAFSAMGLYKINNELARMLGGQVDEAGYVIVDADCQVVDEANKPIPNVYAIGDVRDNWNQIMVGFGDADRAIIHAWSQRLVV